MDSVTLVIPGSPIPKGRARSTRTGRHYTPAATRAAEAAVRAVWHEATGLGRKPHTGPVTVEMEAVFSVPQSWPKWKRELALAGSWPHLSRPDVDNLIKLVKDGLNAVAWLDDSQVTNVSGSKYYGSESCTIVKIRFHDEPGKMRGNTKQ